MAFYGTLRPGESNHYEVRSIPGTWRTGTVRGWTYDITWGPANGYPGMTLDTGAPATPVHVLESAELEQHLRRIDDFEREHRLTNVPNLRLGEVLAGSSPN